MLPFIAQRFFLQITGAPTDLQTNDQLEAINQTGNTLEESIRGLKRGRSNEANIQKSKNQRRRPDQETSQDHHNTGKKQAGTAVIDKDLRLGHKAHNNERYQDNDQVHREEGDQNIVASAANSVQPSRENSISGRRDNRRFPMTPRHRLDSFSSGDLSEDHDEQNIFKDHIEVAPTGDVGRQFLVRNTCNLEPSSGE